MTRCLYCDARPGTHKLKAKIWAVGRPHDDRFATLELLGDLICEGCGKDVVFGGPKEFFAPEGAEMIRKSFAGIGLAVPDLEGAELFLEPLIAGPAAGNA